MQCQAPGLDRRVSLCGSDTWQYGQEPGSLEAAGRPSPSQGSCRGRLPTSASMDEAVFLRHARPDPGCAEQLHTALPSQPGLQAAGLLVPVPLPAPCPGPLCSGEDLPAEEKLPRQCSCVPLRLLPFGVRGPADLAPENAAAVLPPRTGTECGRSGAAICPGNLLLTSVPPELLEAAVPELGGAGRSVG